MFVWRKYCGAPQYYDTIRQRFDGGLNMLKCASFFAGVGGIDLGFEKAGFETIYANEIDPYAAQTFEHNFNIKVDCRDIYDVQVDEIPDFDIMLAGFPCQAFSIAGYRQGFNDKQGRGELFFELVRILKVKQPRIAFFENVKNKSPDMAGIHSPMPVARAAPAIPILNITINT